MGDVMLFGILRMPYNMAMANEISRHQYWQSVQQAADEIERLRHIATFLFDVLDDIDTASDEAKNDDAWYRKRVQHLHKKRFEVMTTDGFNVFPRSALQQKDTE